MAAAHRKDADGVDDGELVFLVTATGCIEPLLPQYQRQRVPAEYEAPCAIIRRGLAADRGEGGSIP